MTNHPGMQEIDSGMHSNAISVYGQSENAYEDFPVLKAFQQYIDAEQSKARKRMLLICAFFGVLMFVVISVFVMLLVNANSRNQMLNDRLVEFAMKDRQAAGSAVVVQPSQDASAIFALTAKLEEMQKKLADNQAKTEKIVSNATAKAEQAAIREVGKKSPTAEELEISRLKALLATEREKQAIEREKLRQAELEEYRRKHYPELYEQATKPKAVGQPSREPKKINMNDEDRQELLDEVDEILEGSGDEAVSYFDEEDDDLPSARKEASRRNPPSAVQPTSRQKEYSIPVEIRGSSSRWRIPND